MNEELQKFIGDFPGKFKKVRFEEAKEKFDSEFKILLNHWSKRAFEQEIAEGDTEEEKMLRLSNDLVYGHDYEKYGLSVALWIEYNGIYYGVLVGKGKMEIGRTRGVTDELLYDQPESTATVAFGAIKYATGKDWSYITLSNFSPSTGPYRLM